MSENPFDDWIAQRYQQLWPELFDPAMIDATVAFLADLADVGPALELGIGTGRIALPLSRRGITVHGIDQSPAMIAQLQAQPDAHAIGVTVGDFAHATVDRTFRLAYLLRNTITNLTTQDEQVGCFRNVAAHLAPGGLFVIENYIPEPRNLPPGDNVHVFARTPTHLAFEEYHLAEQIAVSHHYWMIDGQLRTFVSRHRYLWPAELDLMARLAGMTLRERWSDWHRTPLRGDSRSHVSVWVKPAADQPWPATSSAHTGPVVALPGTCHPSRHMGNQT